MEEMWCAVIAGMRNTAKLAVVCQTNTEYNTSICTQSTGSLAAEPAYRHKLLYHHYR